jgi:multiple sugar transport system permease protein
MKKYLPLLRILAVGLAVLLAWNLRSYAVATLPVDFDEDDYLRAAQEYAAVFRSGDLTGLTQFNYRPEHPPLSKILYGLSILPAPETPLLPDRPTSAGPDQTLPKDQLRNARTAGAILGTLTALAVALLNPLAGIFLAAHSWTIKYTSQVMLEALPALTSLLAVLAYRKAMAQNGILRPKITWLVVSALFLGLTAASKYIYCLVGVAILIDWFLENRQTGKLVNWLASIIPWGLFAILVFFLANPYLWPDPLTCLADSVFYHARYSTGAAEVASANFPLWQPFNWLGMSVPWNQQAFRVLLDPFITLLAAFGLVRLWKKERVYVLWLITAILFLLAWPTKWPQYLLVLTVPLSLAAAEGAISLLEAIRFSVLPQAIRSRIRSSAPHPLTTSAHPLSSADDIRPSSVHPLSSADNLRRAAPWLLPGLLAFLVLTIFPLLFQLGMSMTTLNAQSLRDGLQGGLLRELWGGLTGQIPAAGQDASPNQVHFIGLRGYGWVFAYVSSIGVPVFTILWTALSVSLQLALGLGAALLLWNRRVALRKTWQVLFILPWAIPEAIGALMWLNIFAPLSGWLSLAVKDFGAQNVPFSFLVGWERNPNQTLIILLLASLWYGFPFLMLAASAGLKMLPTEVFDAAAIDGATPWQTFRHVTWPLLTPLLIPAIIIRAIFAFNQFYLFQMFVQFFGGQQYIPVTLSTYSYYLLYRGSEFGVSAILNIITILMLIGFVVLFNRWSKAGEGVTYA